MSYPEDSISHLETTALEMCNFPQGSSIVTQERMQINSTGIIAFVTQTPLDWAYLKRFGCTDIYRGAGNSGGYTNLRSLVIWLTMKTHWGTVHVQNCMLAKMDNKGFQSTGRSEKTRLLPSPWESIFQNSQSFVDPSVPMNRLKFVKWEEYHETF